jgi:hypothetical protein
MYSALVNLDNHHKIPGTNTCISSQMIVQDFGGLESMARKLFTDLKVSTMFNTARLAA